MLSRLLILLLVVTIMLPGCFDKPGKKESAAISQLRLEDIWKTAGYDLQNSTRQRVHAYLNELFQSGFMPLYRKVYYQLYASETAPFENKFAAASAILLASHNLVNDAKSRNSGKRLFLLFCQNVLVDGEFAIKMSRLNRKHKIFSEDSQLQALWEGYIREVWGRVYKPEVLKKHVFDEKTQKFVTEFPKFESEISSLLNSRSNDLNEEKYDYFLKEGKTGVNESDYELRKVSD